MAGVAIHLQQGDLVTPSRAKLHEIVQTRPLSEIIASLRAVHRKPGEKKKQPITGPSVTATFHMAAGMALAAKLQNKSGMTLAFAHIDSAPGDFWREAVSFTSENQLPVVFVVSQFIDGTGAGAEVRGQAQAFLPAITVDGSDVVAVYRVAEETTRRARQGLGPSLIECAIERARDPLRFMEDYLAQRKLWSDAWKHGLVQQFARELDGAVKKQSGKSGYKTAAID